MLGLLVSFGHFLLSKPHERPRVDFVILAAIAQFWLAAVFAGALILGPRTATPWLTTMITAVIVWVGFVVPTLMVTLRFRGHSGPMAAADSLHWLLVLLVLAAVMRSMGLEAPLM